MIEQLKKIAQSTAEAGKPACWMFGTVTSAAPIKVQIDNRFEIGEKQLVIMEPFRKGYIHTHKHKAFQQTPATEIADNHEHRLKDNYWTCEDDESEYTYGLEVGDKVVLLQNAGGQEYLILGRMPKGG